MKTTCGTCRYFHANSALNGDAPKGSGRCHFNPPTAMPVPAAAGPRVFAIHPPVEESFTACKEFKAEDP